MTLQCPCWNSLKRNNTDRCGATSSVETGHSNLRARKQEIQRTVGRVRELALGGGEESSPIEVRPVVSEFRLRVSCRSILNKAFLHLEESSSSKSGLHPQAFKRLEEENTKLLATHNLADLIPVFKLVMGKLDVQGIDVRICPGRALAMRVLSAAVGSFVHAFEWSTLPGVELTANEGTHGLNIRPELHCSSE